MTSDACTRSRDVDWSAWLADPSAPEWRDFVEHYPWCEECAREVDRVDALIRALRDHPPDPGTSDCGHPPPRELALYIEEAESLDADRRDQIEAHLGGCAPCRSELRAFRRFDFSRLTSDREADSPPLVRSSARQSADVVSIDSRPDAPVRTARRSIWRDRRSRAPLMGLAAAAILALAFVFATNRPEEDPGGTLASNPSPVRETPGTDAVEGWSSRDEILVAAVVDLGPAPYRSPPDLVDMPWLRSRAGLRGGGVSTPAIRAIAPPRLVTTRLASPVLWWHLSMPTVIPIGFTLTEAESGRVVRDLQLSGPTKVGFHRIPLSELDVELTPGIVYEWRVGLSLEPGWDAANPSSGGAIRRSDPAKATAIALDGPPVEVARQWHAWAREGLWYEAFDFISELVERNPDIEDLARLRSALLEEAGLGDLVVESASESIGR